MHLGFQNLSKFSYKIRFLVSSGDGLFSPDDGLYTSEILRENKFDIVKMNRLRSKINISLYFIASIYNYWCLTNLKVINIPMWLLIWLTKKFINFHVAKNSWKNSMKMHKIILCHYLFTNFLPSFFTFAHLPSLLPSIFQIYYTFSFFFSLFPISLTSWWFSHSSWLLISRIYYF